MMTVAELLSVLEGMDPNAEVRIATQPSWPLAFEVAGAAELDASLEDEGMAGESVVWLATGDQAAHPYAPAEAWESAERW